MTIKPKTIDNLGVDASSRYARDQATLDPKFIQESRFIPQKTEVSVVKPYLPTEFEEYLAPSLLMAKATFETPPGFFEYGRSLFTYQLIPSLGSAEKQLADKDKLEALKDKDHEQEKKRKKLLKCLNAIIQKDRDLNQINLQRTRYQRG